MSTTEAPTPPSHMDELIHYVQTATVAYRKGDVVKEEVVEDIKVVTIDNFPAEPEEAKTVDCHFITVGATEALGEHTPASFYGLVLANEHNGIFAPMTAEDWARGPSYIAIGGWLGDQTLALQFMALAELHGMGKVVIPSMLGLTGEKADAAAGSGYVLLTGLKDPST